MTLAISALTLLVPDYEAGIDFYCRVMGFELQEDTQLSATKRWVVVSPSGAVAGAAALVLAKADGPIQQQRIGDQAGGRVFLFLSTDDFAADHARMTGAGVRFVEVPRQEPFGTVAVFEDPFGNRWDLIGHAPS